MTRIEHFLTGRRYNRSQQLQSDMALLMHIKCHGMIQIRIYRMQLQFSVVYMSGYMYIFTTKQR